VSFFRKDWVERQIEEVARALARLIQLEREKRYQDAEGLLQETAQSLTGLPYSTLLALDAASVASLLERTEQVLALAQLLDRDGALRRKARLEGAEARELRAVELYRLAIARGAASSPAEEAISGLLARLDLANGPQSE
jgi:hypothetical protein